MHLELLPPIQGPSVFKWENLGAGLVEHVDVLPGACGLDCDGFVIGGDGSKKETRGLHLSEDSKDAIFVVVGGEGDVGVGVEAE